MTKRGQKKGRDVTKRGQTKGRDVTKRGQKKGRDVTKRGQTKGRGRAVSEDRLPYRQREHGRGRQEWKGKIEKFKRCHNLLERTWRFFLVVLAGNNEIHLHW